MNLTKNLNYLRKKHKVSQQVLADVLGVARTTLGDYERGKTEPNIETLIKIAEYFDVKVDDLIRENLSHQDLEILRNKDMRVLAISVDSENRQNIELVDKKAEAGYLESFQDPEYISELPKLYFPQIPEGTYRAFEIQGNSMLPLLPGSIVICGYVEDLRDLKNDRTYVIATREGIVYKRIFTNINEHSITAISDNPAYPPYTIPFEDIAEIWQYYAHVSFSDMKSGMDQWLESNIGEIQRKLDDLIEKEA